MLAFHGILVYHSEEPPGREFLQLRCTVTPDTTLLHLSRRPMLVPMAPCPFPRLIQDRPSYQATSSPGPGRAWRGPQTRALSQLFLSEAPPYFLSSPPWGSRLTIQMVPLQQEPRITSVLITRYHSHVPQQAESWGNGPSKAWPLQRPHRVCCICSVSTGADGPARLASQDAHGLTVK